MTPVQTAVQRGDVVPREAYDRVRRTFWRLESERWAALRLACYLLVIVNAWELADADTLARADAELRAA